MLTVKLEENRLTVITPITKEYADKVIGNMDLRDEKTGDVLCSVRQTKDGEGTIGSTALFCNTVVDGKLAVEMVLPMDTTMDDVKRTYGTKIVNLNKHIDKLDEQIKANADAVDAIFAE